MAELSAQAKVQRRAFLKGAGLASGVAMAAAAVATTSVGAGPAEAASAVEPGPVDAVPFEGAHQAGIARPVRPQAAASFTSFAITARDAAGLQELLQTLTDRIRFLTSGGLPAPLGAGQPPSDSEVLGPDIPPDGLTVTVGLAAGAFDHRFGLAGKKPTGLTEMTVFPNDVPDPAWTGGDLLLQVNANSVDTVHHALRDLRRHTQAWIQPVWQTNGFISPPRPTGTPRNLFGYKDGISNPDAEAGAVWISADSGQPEWAQGGTFIVVRLIRMLVEFWDRVSLLEQDGMIGRRRSTGAPLDGQQETDEPRYDDDPQGRVTPLTSHIRLAHPRTAGSEATRMLRRSYNYVAGNDANGTQNVGLIFASYQANIQRQFEAAQLRLVDEPMTDYVQPFGGQYFIALPGVTDPGSFLGRGLFG